MGRKYVLTWVPWYHTNSTEDGWQSSIFQNAAEETAAEVAYLGTVLEAFARGKRVLHLSCGVGVRGCGLAEAGFEVIEADLSPWTIDATKRQRTQTNSGDQWPTAALGQVDLRSWGEVDAAICSNVFGWGADQEQRRLLRRIQRLLAKDGILILIVPNLHWLIRQCTASSLVRIGTATYRLEQRYNPTSGRAQGSLTLVPDGTSADAQSALAPHALAYDLRIYSVPEVISLTREAGFAIEQTNADFQLHSQVGLDSQSIQICARRLLTPPFSLAVTSWRTSSEARLDLRYAPDEAEWLEPSPARIWEEVINRESRHGADAVGWYPVDDPYGGERAAAVVSKHFGCNISPRQVSVGPGVTSLLHDLVDLADGGLILGRELLHPDLTAWAVARGLEVHLLKEPTTLDQFTAAIHAKRPALVQLDRPNFAGESIALDKLYSLGMAAAQVGALVLVDESPATYFGPSGSAVPLIYSLNNLVVLRGLTKAYSWGGLRAGFTFASDEISARVRELICPLQVGELALRAALHLLAAGDIFHRLRGQIHLAKAQTLRLLRAASFEVHEGHPDLPWVVVPDGDGAVSTRLDCLGIRGLRFVASPAAPAPGPQLLALFCPLSEARLATLRRHLKGGI